MAEIKNVKIYGLEESIFASGYPLRKYAPSEEEFLNTIEEIRIAGESFPTVENNHLKRALLNLGQTEIGEGHDNFLNGIVVQFDLTFTIKAWYELQRYHFIDFVSSMSLMHRGIAIADFGSFCDNVLPEVVNLSKSLANEALASKDKEDKLSLLYNLPLGTEFTARMTTNYRQLKTILLQRRTHLLPDWQVFCDWIESLPYAEYLLIPKKKGVQ